MKITVFVFCVSLPFLFGCKRTESTISVPDTISKKFNSLYPNATDLTWEMEDSLFEASFMLDTVNTSITFSPDGTPVDLESAIPISSLPPAITDYTAQQLAGKRIKGATMITHADGTVSYEIDVENTDYLFDGTGQFIKSEAEESEGE